MACPIFNGSAFTFATVLVGSIRSANYSVTGTEIEVSDIDDLTKFFCTGQSDNSLTLTTVGAQSGALAVGDQGPMVIAWADGTTDTINDMVITSRSPAGSMDGELITTYTFKQTRVVA